MNLFLADTHKSFDDLYKGMKINLMPKTPGAATGGSGSQVVDCPLGAACPSGGKHQMGSKKLEQHTKQAQQQSQTGKVVGDESTGEDTGKQGVTPASQNIGSVGSDQAERPMREPAPLGGEKGRKTKLDIPGQEVNKLVSGHDKTLVDVPGQEVNKLVSGHDKTIAHDPKGAVKQSDVQKVGQDPHTAATRPIGTNEIPTKGHDPNAPDERQTLREMPAYAEDESGYENPASQKKTLSERTINLDRPGRTDVPNPMNPETAPPDSKPMDHYRLAQVARASGDHENAEKHEALARQRTEGWGSEDHKKLSEQLRAEGMNQHADFHEGIHGRATAGNKAEVPFMTTKDQHQQLADLGYSKQEREAMKPEEVQAALSSGKTKNQAAQHEEKMSSVHEQQSAKAKKVLADAKSVHENTKKKATEIRERNQKATAEHEAAMKDYEAKKAEGGKKLKKPTKPKLEEEPEVPETPELSEPESDSEKLRHQNHTERAKKHAEMIESHLKNNPHLSDSERKRLERAHAVSVFHSNIEHTPKAAHKAELAEAEKTTKDMGINESWENQKAREDAAAEGAAVRANEADKQKAAQQQPEVPQPPQNPMEHARVQDHAGKAQALRDKVQSHLDQNPNLSEPEKQKAQHILSVLDEHANMQNVPTSEQSGQLKELHKLAGDMGKKPYEPTDEEGTGGAGAGPGMNPHHGKGGSTLDYLMGKVGEGQAGAAGMASAVTSPYGAGRTGTQAVNYGIHGAVSVGHQLLHDAGDNEPKYSGSGQAQSVEQQKAKQDTEAARTEKQAMAKQVGTGGSA